MLHASREDPNNYPRVFVEYANSNSWIAARISQFADGIVVFAGGRFVALRLLVQSKSSRTASALAWIGFATSNNSSEPFLFFKPLMGSRL
ncbi:MAG: hypothetical protein JO297_17965 [Nitrososphaeraceae archaeon]|nr:hypothetical protein [Nitrososphaeraceae archaeon]